VRRLNDRTIERIRGTDGGHAPVISPDGNDLLFAGTSTIKRVPLRGGVARTVIDSAATNGQVTWSSRGQLMYSFQGQLWLAPADGGTPSFLAAPDSLRGHVGYGFPSWFPDGKRALITIWKGMVVVDSAVLGVVSIPDGHVTELGVRGAYARYSRSGHVFYATVDNQLVAATVPFTEGATASSEIVVAEGLRVGTGNGAAGYDVSRNGTVAFYGGTDPKSRMRTLVDVDRSGRTTPLNLPPGYYQTPRISADGKRIAFTAYTGVGNPTQAAPNPDVWVWDARSATVARVTTDSVSWRASWTTDGARLTYLQRGTNEVMTRMLDDGSPASVYVRSPMAILEAAPGRDRGPVAIRAAQRRSLPSDIFLAHPDSANLFRKIVGEATNEISPRISADGQLLAYVSSRTGQDEVYVRPLNGDGAEILVSPGGGTEPAWSRSGRELFFRSATHLMFARFTAGARPTLAARDTLFTDRYQAHPGLGNFDVFPDGQHFVMVRGGLSLTSATPLTVIVNWQPPPPTAR
jgi:Tol biopolymer transport system component